MGESMMTASDNAGFERRNYPKPVIWQRKTDCVHNEKGRMRTAHMMFAKPSGGA